MLSLETRMDTHFCVFCFLSLITGDMVTIHKTKDQTAKTGQ